MKLLTGFCILALGPATACAFEAKRSLRARDVSQVTPDMKPLFLRTAQASVKLARKGLNVAEEAKQLRTKVLGFVRESDLAAVPSLQNVFDKVVSTALTFLDKEKTESRALLAASSANPPLVGIPLRLAELGMTGTADAEKVLTRAYKQEAALYKQTKTNVRGLVLVGKLISKLELPQNQRQEIGEHLKRVEKNELAIALASRTAAKRDQTLAKEAQASKVEVASAAEVAPMATAKPKLPQPVATVVAAPQKSVVTEKTKVANPDTSMDATLKSLAMSAALSGYAAQAKASMARKVAASTSTDAEQHDLSLSNFQPMLDAIENMVESRTGMKPGELSDGKTTALAPIHPSWSWFPSDKESVVILNLPDADDVKEYETVDLHGVISVVAQSDTAKGTDAVQDNATATVEKQTDTNADIADTAGEESAEPTKHEDAKTEEPTKPEEASLKIVDLPVVVSAVAQFDNSNGTDTVQDKANIAVEKQQTDTEADIAKATSEEPAEPAKHQDVQVEEPVMPEEASVTAVNLPDVVSDVAQSVIAKDVDTVQAKTELAVEKQQTDEEQLEPTKLADQPTKSEEEVKAEEEEETDVGLSEPDPTEAPAAAEDEEREAPAQASPEEGVETAAVASERLTQGEEVYLQSRRVKREVDRVEASLKKTLTGTAIATEVGEFLAEAEAKVEASTAESSKAVLLAARELRLVDPAAAKKRAEELRQRIRNRHHRRQ
mmetsp:Transcript_27996/g.92996  ORF Transcript_27996/g.92996 Transcript_27996/m.92996 type:complete len:722 (+) Transcript_27996:31-2196(+)